MPVTIGKGIIHWGTTVALLTYVVLRATRLAAKWKEFAVRYRFAFGSVRPNRYWWILLQLCFGFMMNFIQAVTRDAHSQLYWLISGIMAFTFVQAVSRPFKFLENNVVDLTCKTVLILFLVFATSYIDYSNMSPSDTERMNMGPFLWLWSSSRLPLLPCSL